MGSFSRYAPREKNNLTIDRCRQGYGARITEDEDKRSTSLRRKHNRIAPTRLRAAENTEATKPRANLQYYVKSDSINFQRRLDTRLVSNNHPEAERKERVLGWRSGFVGSTEVRMVTDRSQKSYLRRMPSCTRTMYLWQISTMNFESKNTLHNPGHDIIHSNGLIKI